MKTLCYIWHGSEKYIFYAKLCFYVALISLHFFVKINKHLMNASTCQYCLLKNIPPNLISSWNNKSPRIIILTSLTDESVKIKPSDNFFSHLTPPIFAIPSFQHFFFVAANEG